MPINKTLITTQDSLVFAMDGNNRKSYPNTQTASVTVNEFTPSGSTPTNATYLSCDSTPFRFGNESFTLGCWGRLDSTANFRSLMGIFRESPYHSSYLLSFRNLSEFSFWIDSTKASSSGSLNYRVFQGIVLGNWYLLVGGYDADTQEAFGGRINNSLAQIGTIFRTSYANGPDPTVTLPFIIGSNNGAVASNFPAHDGGIRNAFVLNRVITDDEFDKLGKLGLGLNYDDLPTTFKNDLISYWPLTETGGTRYDVHGNNDLTPSNSPSASTVNVDNITINLKDGKSTFNSYYRAMNGLRNVNGVWQFDGVNDYIDLGSSLDVIRNSPATTMSVWFKRNSGSNTSTFFGADSLSSNFKTIRFRYNSLGQVAIDYGNTSADNYQVYNTTLDPTIAPADTWVNIAFTKDSGGTIASNHNIKLYVNGVSIPLSNTSEIGSDGKWFPDVSELNNWNIGRRNSDTLTEHYLNGSIGSFKLYDRALTADEILQNYNVTKWRFIQRSYPNTT